ncbi:universal stress protein UspA [Methylobacterium sp. Leaf456]|uniref:universal stress protein n=1 Tax=Methylobacterium sp. Leaf456 TaxID=1736382 RepID=UPI0006F81B09|nr:universal stress protein [Methylobacterium sp. Leaf456]KQT59912.1 universal stress protein UspA [Methylobacterium sp. Leaf456]
MTYASIMVAVDLTAPSRERVRLAGHLADDFGAGLIGVAAEEPAFALAPVGPTPASAYALAAASESVLTDLKAAHAAFLEAAGPRSGVEWRSNLDFPLPYLIAQAACADLVVVRRRSETGPPAFTLDPGDLVMRLGRPMLLVPPGTDHLEAKRVAIAWKNTREARRAMRDALPFLLRASHVAVITVDEGKGRDDEDGRDTVRLLQAHGIEASAVQGGSGDATTAEALLDAVGEQGADLIVAGAYGHGRLREWAFGGVTRDLLHGAPVCCLLSH